MAYFKSLESQYRFVCSRFASINSNCALRCYIMKFLILYFYNLLVFNYIVVLEGKKFQNKQKYTPE